MLQLKPLTEQVLVEKSKCFKNQQTRISDYTATCQFMWALTLPSFYAEEENCLILYITLEGKNHFYYPLSERNDPLDEQAALTAIEKYCVENGQTLRLLNISEEKIPLICRRYGTVGVRVETIRRWNEYLYEAEEFKSFAGKKYAGQRNHIHKFYKNYPTAQFKKILPSNIERIKEFFTLFEQTQFTKNDWFAVEEMKAVKQLPEKMQAFSLVGGYMEVEGKIVSVAMGEVCGDTLIEHVEKALREYDGVYTATAQAFVKEFASDGVKYLNREDDSGDLGLRKSKLQYNPCAMLKKYYATVEKPLSKLSARPVLHGERITLKAITKKYAEEYAALAGDRELNRWWGFDYATLLKKGETATPQFFLKIIQDDFKDRNELSLGIFVKGKLVGEAVLHNFGYDGTAEVGARLLPAAQKNGYAREAVKLLINYAMAELDVEKVVAKCYLPNENSRRMLLASGMKENGQDETFYYFYHTPDM